MSSVKSIFATGLLILTGSWMFSLKSIKHIVLRKGGRDVTFITYAPFNKSRYLDAPLKNVMLLKMRNVIKFQ